MKLKLVNKILEAKDTYSFYFDISDNNESKEKLNWLSGQYLVLTLSNIQKQFTIASSPTEKEIRITTRIRSDSEFKQQLNHLEIGSEIEAQGPFGTFTISEDIDSKNTQCFLAGGIGITPFRSMIKYNLDKNLKTNIYLIYSNSDAEFVFKNELDIWQKEYPYLKITYFDSSIKGHLDKEKLLSLTEKYDVQNITFWAVGPSLFVNAIEDILEELNTSQDHIKTEKFIGY